MLNKQLHSGYIWYLNIEMSLKWTIYLFQLHLNQIIRTLGIWCEDELNMKKNELHIIEKDVMSC